MTVYVVFRTDCWYLIGLINDDQAKVVADNNPGTIRVETWDGRLVWHSMSEGETVQ